MPSADDSIQAAYRRQIAEGWQIAEGARILEIGCGQGDMTAILAECVGDQGRVVAVDNADPSYGAPLTLGEATDLLKDSELGSRIEFHFNFDVLHQNFPEDVFDYVVLCHSSWYFQSESELTALLRRVRPWAKRLLFAEWDLTPSDFDQLAHLFAVVIQGQVEAFKERRMANVRTPLTRDAFGLLLEASGWRLVSNCQIDSRGLQDADWEIRISKGYSDEELSTLQLPENLRSFLRTQICLLHTMALPRNNQSLNSYSIQADRK